MQRKKYVQHGLWLQFSRASRNTLKTYVDHIHLQLPLNSDKFNLCSYAIRRFSFTAHRPNAVVHRVRKSTPLDFWR